MLKRTCIDAYLVLALHGSGEATSGMNVHVRGGDRMPSTCGSAVQVTTRSAGIVELMVLG